jgi:hypothetical protein
LVYVDDIAIASNDAVAIRVLTTLLNEKFHLKDLGTLKFFLGLVWFAEWVFYWEKE